MQQNNLTINQLYLEAILNIFYHIGEDIYSSPLSYAVMYEEYNAVLLQFLNIVVENPKEILSQYYNKYEPQSSSLFCASIKTRETLNIPAETPIFKDRKYLNKDYKESWNSTLRALVKNMKNIK